MPGTLLERTIRSVERFAADEHMFRRVSKVLVAVSGGPDSIASLLVIQALGAQLGFEVTAAHFDHQLRPESAEDMAWVRALCEARGVTCLTGEGDVRRAAEERGLGIEAAARQMRYSFLGFAAGRERADAIATGHTADDQAETVLLRVLRGTGVRGLRGMLPAGPMPEAAAQRLIRPLLCVRREDTVAICTEAGIEPLADPSNADPAYRRNRVRHELLPLMRSINPGTNDALIGIAASARESFADTERLAMALQPDERTGVGSLFRGAKFRAFADLPNEARTLVLEREAGFHKLDFEVNRTLLGNLATVVARPEGGMVRFGGLEVEASIGQLRAGGPIEAASFEAKVVNVPGSTVAGGYRLVVSGDPLPATAESAAATIDMRLVRGALRVRPLARGDRAFVRGMRRKLSNALPQMGVPAWTRRQIVVIADGTEVVAIPGVTLGPEPPEEHAFYVAMTPLQRA